MMTLIPWCKNSTDVTTLLRRWCIGLLIELSTYVATDQPNKLLLHNPLCKATTCLRFDCHTLITIYPTTHIYSAKA